MAFEAGWVLKGSGVVEKALRKWKAEENIIWFDLEKFSLSARRKTTLEVFISEVANR